MHQIILRSIGEVDDSSLSDILFFHRANLCTTTSQFAIICAIVFPCPGSASWSAVGLWWNECFTSQYKPGQWQQQPKSYTLRAPNGLTLQFPPQREIGRTEVGIIKTTSLGKLGPFFTQHWLSRFRRQDHFLLAPCPPLRHSKWKLVFPSINYSTRSFAFEECYIVFPFQHVLVCEFVHLVCESEEVNTWVCVRSLLPNHRLMRNGFPVILLPQTELHYCATADVYLQMTSAHQLQVPEANSALCWVRAGSPARFCCT